MGIPDRSQPPKAIRCVSGALISLILLTTPTAVLAHGGHGEHFQGGTEATKPSGGIQVDAETAKRLGIKVEPVTQERLAVGIKTTGQIEPLPNQQVEVTAPISRAKVVELLVEPGAKSLRGGSNTQASSEEEAPSQSAQTTAANNNSLPVPWWLAGAAGGAAIATAAFIAGAFWSGRVSADESPSMNDNHHVRNHEPGVRSQK